MRIGNIAGGVDAGAAIQMVLACAAVKRVFVGAAEQIVFTATAEQHIVTRAAGQCVGTLGADNKIVAAAAVYVVRAGAAQDVVIAAARGDEVVTRTENEHMVLGGQIRAWLPAVVRLPKRNVQTGLNDQNLPVAQVLRALQQIVAGQLQRAQRTPGLYYLSVAFV